MKKFSFLLLCSLLCAAMSVHAQTYGPWDCGAQGDNVTAILIDGTLTISGTGAMSNYSGLTNRPWHNVRGSVTVLVIEDGVTFIGNLMFQDCTALTSVTIGNSVTIIGSQVFNGCTSLTSVTIPNSITTIGEMMFQNCTSLRSVTIPNSVTSILPNAFTGCTALTKIILADGTTTLTLSSSFSDNVEEVYLGRNVTRGTGSGIWALFGAGVKELTIGASVTSIVSQAFQNCENLKIVIIEDDGEPKEFERKDVSIVKRKIIF